MIRERSEQFCGWVGGLLGELNHFFLMNSAPLCLRKYEIIKKKNLITQIHDNYTCA